MQKVVRFVTFDKKEHASESNALKHLEGLYGNILCKVGKRIVGADFKYSTVLDVLDTSLEDFKMLIKIKEDQQVYEDD